MQPAQTEGHGFTLVDRAHAEISGVSDVDCFNEQLIVLMTNLGTMTISGTGAEHIAAQQGGGAAGRGRRI